MQARRGEDEVLTRRLVEVANTTKPGVGAIAVIPVNGFGFILDE